MGSLRTLIANCVRAIALTAAAAACSTSSGDSGVSRTSGSPDRPATAQAAFARLVEGNQRFASRSPAIVTTAEVGEMFTRNEAGQSPYATILTCADSRLSPAMLFDELLGELFVVREAGNIAVSPTCLGSLEYARVALDTPLLVVMGHQNCGAVDAAFKNIEVSGNIKSFVDVIKPGIAEANSLDEAIVGNVGAVIASIRANSPVLRDADIVGAVYDISTGKVRFLGQP
ncbi:MAG: carbonic anhydrase [Planctomycetes bacterium]|nr:carbonic anhydrase [Planctomycetota bacterium]